jgi:hypothetical protein
MEVQRSEIYFFTENNEVHSNLSKVLKGLVNDEPGMSNEKVGFDYYYHEDFRNKIILKFGIYCIYPRESNLQIFSDLILEKRKYCETNSIEDLEFYKVYFGMSLTEDKQKLSNFQFYKLVNMSQEEVNYTAKMSVIIEDVIEELLKRQKISEKSNKN